MSYLVIKGSFEYISRMYRHLLKEHPSTRGRMKAVRGNKIGNLVHCLRR